MISDPDDEWAAMVTTAPSLVGQNVQRSHLASTLEMLNYILIKQFTVASTSRLISEITSNTNVHVVFSMHMTTFIKEKKWGIETAGKMLSLLRKILRGTKLCETFIKGICINGSTVKKEIENARSLGNILQAFGEKVRQNTKIKSPSSLRNVLFFYARICKAADIDLAKWPDDAEFKLKKTLTQEFVDQVTSGKMQRSKRCWLNLLLSKILKTSFQVPTKFPFGQQEESNIFSVAITNVTDDEDDIEPESEVRIGVVSDEHEID